MDGSVRWVRRLPASSWVFDSGLGPVAAGLAMALFVSMPVGSGPPRGRFALGYGLVLLHMLPLAGGRGFPGGGRRPPLGPVLCTVSVAFWPVGGPSCAAGEVQHGEGWPWRQAVAGDPGARTTWCSAC